MSNSPATTVLATTKDFPCAAFQWPGAEGRDFDADMLVSRTATFRQNELLFGTGEYELDLPARLSPVQPGPSTSFLLLL